MLMIPIENFLENINRTACLIGFEYAIKRKPVGARYVATHFEKNFAL